MWVYKYACMYVCTYVYVHVYVSPIYIAFTLVMENSVCDWLWENSPRMHKDKNWEYVIQSYKSMVYIMNKSGGDYQQGGCLYKLTSDIQWWTPEYSWMSDRPKKQASEKLTSQLLAAVLW